MYYVLLPKRHETKGALSCKPGQSDISRKDLHAAWDMEHKIIRHCDQEKLRIDSNVVYRLSKCTRAGVCLHDAKDEDKFRIKFVHCAKRYFTKVNKILSPQRQLLEGRHIVTLLKEIKPPNPEPVIVPASPEAAFAAVDPGMAVDVDSATCDELFFHIGHINYSTWEFSCLRLHRIGYDENMKILKLAVKDVTMELSTGDTIEDEVQTGIKLFVDHVDVIKSWAMEFYETLDDDSHLSYEDMACRFVEVKKLSSDLILFWKGAELEKSKPKKETKPKQPRQPKRARHNYRPVVDVLCDGEDNGAGSGGDASAHGSGDDGPNDSGDGGGGVSEGDGHEVDGSSGDGGSGDAGEPGTPPAPGGDDDIYDFILPQDSPGASTPEAPCSDNEEHILGAITPPFVPSEPASEADADADADVEAPSESQAPRALGRPEFIFNMGALGDIRYNSSGFMRAHCPTHGALCRRRRQTTAGHSSGSGRPVGALTAWLMEAHTHINKKDHIASATAPHERRKQAREFFMTLSGSDRFASHYERRKYPNEHDDEPVVFI